jgi:ribonuclease P protein component
MPSGGESRFPSTMRLKRRKDFERVYRQGTIWKGPSFSLHVLTRGDGKQLGIVIPRKWGSAVERNRVKRLLREAFRRNAHRLPSVALIVKPAPGCRNETVEALGQHLVDAVNETVEREVSG